MPLSDVPRLPRFESSWSTSSSGLSSGKEKKSRDASITPGLRVDGRHLKAALKASSWTVAIHLAIVLAYTAAIVIWSQGWEHHTVRLSESARLQTYANAVFHIFILSLSAGALLTAQATGVRAAFANLPQHLTVIGDHLQSWNGLGAALLVVYNNLRFRAAFAPPLITAAYFAALSVLGFSSSFIFAVPSFNIPRELNVSVASGSPDIRTFVPAGTLNTAIQDGLPTNFSSIIFDWFSSSAGVSTLAGVAALGNTSTVQYPGLAGNRIFDTMASPISASNATVTVNYTDFHVKCGSPIVTLTETNITGSFYFNNASRASSSTGVESYDTLNMYAWPTTMSLIYQFAANQAPLTMADTWIRRFTMLGSSTDPTKSAPGNYTAAMFLPSDVMVRIPGLGTSQQQPIGRNLALYIIRSDGSDPAGGQPILDAKGSSGTAFPLPGTFSPFINESTFQVQPVACSLSTTSGTAEMDGATNLLKDNSSSSEPPSQSLWSDWQPDFTMSNKLEDTWASMFLPSSSAGIWYENPDKLSQGQSSMGSEWSCSWLLGTFTKVNSTSSQSMCHVPTAIEQYLSNELFGTSTFTSGNAPNPLQREKGQGNPTLSALEYALAKATAMTMWSAARAGTLSTYPKQTTVASPQRFVDLSLSARPATQSGFASSVVVDTVGRLEIEPIVLFLGFAAAMLLLLIAIYHVLQGTPLSGAHAAPVDDITLLHVAALDTSNIAPRFADVDMQNTLERRRAGVFPVTIVNGTIVATNED